MSSKACPITCYFINGAEEPVNKKGVLKNRPRQASRHHEHGEVQTEIEYKENVKRLGFVRKDSDCYKWLSNLLQEQKILYSVASSIAIFFGYVFQKELNMKYPVPREVYRLLDHIFFWFDENKLTINQLCSQHHLAVQYKGKWIRFSPLYQTVPLQIQPQVTTVSPPQFAIIGQPTFGFDHSNEIFPENKHGDHDSFLDEDHMLFDEDDMLFDEDDMPFDKF